LEEKMKKNCCGFGKGGRPLFIAFMMSAAGLAFAQTGQQAAGKLNELKKAIADSDLVIEIAELSENAVFYPVDIDGARIEVLAVKAPDGTIRTAFNTCQVCYASGRGFYKQQGSVLVCQNCGNPFRMSQVGLRAGGCNPVPVGANYRTDTEKTITISKSYLKEAKGIFAKWRRS
jgi:uncharacterized membrane protein